MKVLIASASFGKLSELPLKRLSSRGFEVMRTPYHRRMTASEVAEVARGCCGIVSGLEPLTREVLTALPELRCISRVGSGLDNVDLDAARELGIRVAATPTAPVTAVAELTLGLILDLLRGITRHDRKLRSGTWQKEPGWLVSGRTLGVVGLGHIGRAVANVLHAVGANVVGHDVAPDCEWAREHHVQLMSLPELLNESSLVTLHVSRRAGEPPLISAPELEALGPEGFLVNVSRGAVVDEDALVAALESKAISGAALDVFAEEPYDGPLARFDNIIVTPHIGSEAHETVANMEREAVENLIRELETSTGGEAR